MKQDQHYIPKFILRKFTNDKTHGFRVFDKEIKRFLDGTQYPKKTMIQKLFYEHDKLRPNEVEDLLSKRETVYASLIQKFLDKETLNKQDVRVLMEFRHVTYYRSSEFIAFHNHKKDRGSNSWLQRADWRMINGIYDIKEYDSDIKLSQLNAIKRTIAGTEPILELSLMTPVCFVFESFDKNFIIGDSGSLSFGGEFDGIIIIVISPEYALMFPRMLKALEIMREFNKKIGDPLIIYETAPCDIVGMINERTKDQAYKYWVEGLVL